MPRLLAVLTVTVLVAALHGWLLVELPWGGRAPLAPASEVAAVFDTRSIAPPPPEPPPEPSPERPPAAPSPTPPPRPQPKPKPRPPAPVPVPATHDTPPAEPPPAPAEAEAASTAEAAEPSAQPSTPDTAPSDPDEVASPVPTPNPPGDHALADADADDAQQGPPPPTGSALAPPQGITLRSAPGQPPQTALPYQAPPAQRLVFQVQGQVKGFSYSASALLLWQPQGLSYHARQEISAFLLGARAQASRGHLTADGLQPERFEDRARKKLRAASMDWASGLARFEPEAPLARIAPGTQDRLSVFLQLAGMLAAAPQRYPPGAEITLPTASTKAVEPWTFQVQGVHMQELPAGTLETVRLERLPRHAGDQKAELWLAPALGYLPARIRLSEDQGDYADLRLQSHSPP